MLKGRLRLKRNSFNSVLLQRFDELDQFLDISAEPSGEVGNARMLRASDFHITWHETMAEYSLLRTLDRPTHLS